MMPKKLKVSINLNDVTVLPVSISLEGVVCSNTPVLSLSDFYTEITEFDSFPRNWHVLPATLDKLTIQSKDIALSISESFHWTLTYNGCSITRESCLVLSNFPEHINSVETLLQVLCKINNAKMCEGNPNQSFVQLAHKGVFLNQSGT